METIEAVKALGPTHIRPQHAKHSEKPQQHREVTSGGFNRLPDRRLLKGGQYSAEPSYNADFGGGNRPWQRDSD